MAVVMAPKAPLAADEQPFGVVAGNVFHCFRRILVTNPHAVAAALVNQKPIGRVEN